MTTDPVCKYADCRRPACTGSEYCHKHTHTIDDVSKLEQLGSKTTDYVYGSPHMGMLETFTNQFPERQYIVKLKCPEFTSLCPKTGQPDFATIKIRYRPKLRCVETKSLKLYLFAFRQEGTFMETITNRICSDLKKVLEPVWVEVRGVFAPRGGIELICRAEEWDHSDIEDIGDE